MAWLYEVATGKMFRPDGTLLGVGGSGRDVGFNNPSMQDVPFVGPLPSGGYTIGEAQDHSVLGPVAMPLTPDPEDMMFGRNDFWIHGWSAERGVTKSSDGCILQSKPCRIEISQSDDCTLRVW